MENMKDISVADVQVKSETKDISSKMSCEFDKGRRSAALCGITAATVTMTTKHQVIRARITDAIVDLCRREAFYCEELRIEGTLCLVSDRSSVLVAQITEQIGEQLTATETKTDELPRLNYEQESNAKESENLPSNKTQLKNSDDSLKENKDGERRFKDGDRFTEDAGFSENATKNDSFGDEHFTKHSAELLKQQKEDEKIANSLLPSGRADGKYKCPFCPKVYGFKHNLKDHINKHTGKKPHVCKYCGMSFTFLASLCGHIKRRHFHCMPREHQCQICGNRFPNKQSLKQHYTWRHCPQKEDKQAKAPRQRKNSSPRHQDLSAVAQDDDIRLEREAFDIKKPKLENQSTPKSSNDNTRQTKALIKQHNAVGPMEIPKVPFSTTPTMRAEGSTPESMEEMDLSQLTALGLTQPKMSSDQPPPGLMSMPLPLLQATSMGFPMFPPPLPMMNLSTSPSPASGPNPGTAASNIRGPQPPPSPQPVGNPPTSQELFRSSNGKFQCPYCDKSYRFKHTLKDHINTHFGKRPHVCKYCGDAFTHFASLCAHIKRRHKEHIPTDFACNICNENFMNLQSLKQHFTWRHKDLKLGPGMLPPYLGKKASPTSTSTAATSSQEQVISSTQSRMSSRMSPSQPKISPQHHQREPRMSPKQSSQLLGVPAPTPPHHLLSPTSPTLPSMEAFMKSGGNPPVFPFPGFPAGFPLALPTEMKDMKDFLGGFSFEQGIPPGFITSAAAGNHGNLQGSPGDGVQHPPKF